MVNDSTGVYIYVELEFRMFIMHGISVVNTESLMGGELNLRIYTPILHSSTTRDPVAQW